MTSVTIYVTRQRCVIICAPYPDNFSMEVVTAACATWGLTADIRKEDTFYGYGSIQIEFRKAQHE